MFILNNSINHGSGFSALSTAYWFILSQLFEPSLRGEDFSLLYLSYNIVFLCIVYFSIRKIKKIINPDYSQKISSPLRTPCYDSTRARRERKRGEKAKKITTVSLLYLCGLSDLCGKMYELIGLNIYV